MLNIQFSYTKYIYLDNTVKCHAVSHVLIHKLSEIDISTETEIKLLPSGLLSTNKLSLWRAK